jgi:mannitol/fructose-specific phosphotransferase system IIA component (Ntr-type)
MANNTDDLEHIRVSCKNMIKELSHLMQLADKLDDPRVIHRLHSAQSKLLFAKLAIHRLLRDEYVEIVYDPDECSTENLCIGCTC